jgi:hypothetical protein
MPKLTNIQVGKKAPQEYLSELHQKNSALATCLPGIPADMISDPTWNGCFKLFLEERSSAIFAQIERYAITPAAELAARYTAQSDVASSSAPVGNLRLKDMLAQNWIIRGDRVYVRKHPDRFAIIVDGDDCATLFL